MGFREIDALAIKALDLHLNCFQFDFWETKFQILFEPSLIATNVAK